MTASLILRKLAACPRQNNLATGLREYGRVERTLFTLKWLRDPALRRRVTGGLNKGNALARTVFFHRPGEIRDRSYENQRYRASGLNLVIAAITLWNTVYLERAVTALRERGSIDESLLGHLDPLGLGGGLKVVSTKPGAVQSVPEGARCHRRTLTLRLI